MAGVPVAVIVFGVMIGEPIGVVVIGRTADIVERVVLVAAVVLPVPGGIRSGGEVVVLKLLDVQIGRPPLAEIRHRVGSRSVLVEIPVGRVRIGEVQTGFDAHPFGEIVGPEEVEEVLNIFDDSYCNKHLLYGVVELIVVRLLPEMAEKGVAELLEDRLS